MARPLSLTLDELRALPQREAELTITCVDGWSATATWRGVALRDLLSMAGPPEAAYPRRVIGVARRLEEAGASTLGYAGFYLLLASVGAQGDLLHADR